MRVTRPVDLAAARCAASNRLIKYSPISSLYSHQSHVDPAIFRSLPSPKYQKSDSMEWFGIAVILSLLGIIT